MTNEEYIREHRDEDIRRLALGKAPEGVTLRWCLQQIEGWQLARRKLPLWATTDGIWYGPRLSMEQCSSEETADYKRKIAERLIPKEKRLRMVDLTGGLGVDFSFLATLFQEATYVEIQPELCRLAQHNLPLLGLAHAVIANPETFSPGTSNFSFIYLDPARRDTAGRKTVSIQDCTPNLLEMQDELLSHGTCVMTKLSPMLDITEALRLLKGVREVHVVSVRGECKELLFVMQSPQLLPIDMAEGTAIHCVNLGTDDDEVFLSPSDAVQYYLQRQSTGITAISDVSLSPHQYGFIYEPNASVLKAGVQDILCQRYPAYKLHAMSNLFVSDRLLPHFPGRRFRIVGVSDFTKHGLRVLIGDLSQANLTTRNFPTSVASLRRQLRLSEGGEAYLFATTLGNGQHALIRCERV